MIRKNLKIAIRDLRRNRLFSLLGIIGFSAGFSICLIIGLFVYKELTIDTYNKNYDRIYRLIDSETKNANLDYRLNETLKNKYAAIEKACPIHINGAKPWTVYTDTSSVYIDGVIATDNSVFDLMSVNVVKSMSNNPFADKNSSIITHSAANKIFGTVDPIGKKLKVGTNETIISAVIKDFPHNSSIKGSILLNSENSDFRLNSNFANGEIFNTTNHYILLKENESKESLEKTINESIGTYYKTVKAITLQPLNAIYFDTDVIDGNNHGNYSLVKIISIIGILILLLSIINYINYILSLQYKRIKEIGIKKVNGASNKNIVSQYLADVFLWVLIAFIISLITVQFSLPYFNQIFQEELKIQTLTTSPFIISIIMSLAVVVLISSIPLAILLSKFNYQNFLNNTVFKTKNKFRSSLLPIFQLSICMLLITGVLTIQKQIFYAKHKDLGFNKNQLLYINVPFKALDPESFKAELLNNPSIEKVALSGGTLGDISMKMSSIKWDFDAYQIDVDDDFLETMQIELLKGRNVSPNDKKQCIVNEAAIKAFELKDSIGEKIKPFQDEFEIVGIVKDFNFGPIHRKIEPLLIKYGINRNVSVRMDANNIASTMQYINKVWDDMTTNEPLEYEFYDLKFDSMYKKEELLANACSLFAIIAIIITCLGLWGQIIFISTNKSKEIGIRKVNGATIKDILIMLNKNFVKWVLVAFVVACPIAYFAMSKWLENFAYKTSLNWWVFALAGIFTLLIAMLTVSWESYNAAKQNPVDSLRDE
ncbi:ABC transporter permease [Confluentibacter sediminis]|uniref:ABC transporter permease n=1 Tax=Confluentibacter sediminis TaxID=2219045 RepID=UPI000DAE10E5|nr:FtsX-like permease family protein [Confluentibacter sediminis]